MPLGPAVYLPCPPLPMHIRTSIYVNMHTYVCLVQRIAELQEDNSSMQSVEKLKGAQDSQLSTRCSKLTG